MSEEKKNVPLSEDELGEVAGGGVIACSAGANPQTMEVIINSVGANADFMEVIMNSTGAKPTCPVCGAATTLDPATGKLTCPTCGWTKA